MRGIFADVELSGLVVGVTTVAILSGSAAATPVSTVWPLRGGDDTVAVAAARVSGRYAAADAFEDNVEIRTIEGVLTRAITRAEIEALAPWLNLGGGPDGPSGLAWTDSGRALYILVHDDTSAGSDQPSDVVLRYDVFTDRLTLFAQLTLFDRGDFFPLLGAVHYRGRLYVGTAGNGVYVYQAESNDEAGALLDTYPLPSGTFVHGLAIDPGDPDSPEREYLYAASEMAVYRLNVNDQAPTFEPVGSSSGLRAIAYSDHYGSSANAGLYVLDGTGLYYVSEAQARGAEPFAPVLYLATAGYALAATADGKLLIGMDEDAQLSRDDSDTHLPFADWLQDEFRQVVTFAKTLISPDGEPPGWVIDADVGSDVSGRFHPATPDAAGFVVLVLILADRINADPDAESLVQDILVRYAGLASDGIAPRRTSDGIFGHWLDPFTGCVKPGWDDEFAVLSTMLVAVGAARAATAYPGNPMIQAAAGRIIGGVRNWEDYFLGPGADCSLYLRARQPAGPKDPLVRPFFEGILYIEQAAAYGAGHASPCFDRWLDRSLWPTAEIVTGKPVTGNTPSSFLPAYISHWPFLLQAPFRYDSRWKEQMRNLFNSSSAWTDDNAPLYFRLRK